MNLNVINQNRSHGERTESQEMDIRHDWKEWEDKKVGERNVTKETLQMCILCEWSWSTNSDSKLKMYSREERKIAE